MLIPDQETAVDFLNFEAVAKDLLAVVKTKKTELLLPDGVLFGSSRAHKELRRILVEDQKLDPKSSARSLVLRRLGVSAYPAISASPSEQAPESALELGILALAG